MKMLASAGALSVTSGNPCEGETKSINPELWQACAGPLVSLPPAGTHVLYFPQGHSEQVAASMKKDVDGQIPNYPNLPSKLLCILHNVTLHADPETDEVYAQMTLQPVSSFDKDALLRSDLALKANKPQTDFFCKTLTASDTSTHGGFSVPRRAAEKIFPPLDFSMQPPAQELVARDLHDNMWTFRHIYRGQPKRHLLTTGWSLFVSGKRLLAGDSVLFIRDEKQLLLLGIRRACRQPTTLSSSVLSSDSMHIGILAAAAHAAANNSPFTVFYNPRTSPSEFVIPLAKYYKSVYSSQVSPGMRFRMMFETEESGTRRYMGTITGISDLDPVRWKNSQWRNLQVGWDESTTGERRNRVSIWEIEPVTAPFFFCPPPFFRPKRPRHPGMPGCEEEYSDMDNLMKRTMPWVGDEIPVKDPQAFPGLSLVQWMSMQQNHCIDAIPQPNYASTISGSVLQNLIGADMPHQLGMPVQPSNNLQFNNQRSTLDHLSKVPMGLNQLSSIIQHPQQRQLGDAVLQPRQSIAHQTHPQPQRSHLLTSAQQSQPSLHPDNQIGIQKFPQQQLVYPSAQLLQLQDPQRKLLEVPSVAVTSSHTLDLPQPVLANSLRSCIPPQPGWFSDGLPSMPSVSSVAVGCGQSGVTDDPPSCSTSPSTNNSANAIHSSPGGLETLMARIKPEVKQPVPMVKSQQNPHQNYGNTTVVSTDCLDTSSSATGESQLNQNNSNPFGFTQQSMLFREMNDAQIDAPLVSADQLLVNSGSNLSSGGVVCNFDQSTDVQELSSSFGVPDIPFNSIDDGGFVNHTPWAPPAQLPRMRSFTKVYKRGAVGRSIDIARYSGYDELKQDLARRFGIEGQMEDRQKVGWKLVYVDHEKDVLLLGDDPWEEFVGCVRCIKILSPQEVQQMSLDGDFATNLVPNQACSSSDGGNT